jgi:hypothetical protein
MREWSEFAWDGREKHPHKTGEIVPGFALQLGGVPESIDEPKRKTGLVSENQVLDQEIRLTRH